MTDFIARIDLADWRAGGARADEVAAAVDEGMQRAGFLLVAGHGIPTELAAQVRASARAFFALPAETKGEYAARVGERGWIGPGMEANGYSEGTETPPDLKETFAIGADEPTGDAEADALWFLPNVWPTQEPELREALVEYERHCRRVTAELLELFAAALHLPANPFAELGDHPTWTLNVNHYPAMETVGAALPGQFRIGPHTDFGTVTLLDREPGVAGLQVHSDESGWVDAPYAADALTVNIGDLLAHWSAGRWRSGRHRVLPPDPTAPQEDLVSLIYFGELNHDAEVVPLTPPLGREAGVPTVTSGDFIRERLDAITISS
jgi:isopenicillin N synthase-like dioxygenase